MESHVYDTFKSEKIANNMETNGEFEMKNFNFMPTLEILPNGDPNPDVSKTFDMLDITDMEDAHYDKNDQYLAFPIDMTKL